MLACARAAGPAARARARAQALALSMPTNNPQTNLIYFIPLLSRRSFNMPIEWETVSQRNVERTVPSQCRWGKIININFSSIIIYICWKIIVQSTNNKFFTTLWHLYIRSIWFIYLYRNPSLFIFSQFYHNFKCQMSYSFSVLSIIILLTV